jgi:hypothetical protein
MAVIAVIIHGVKREIVHLLEAEEGGGFIRRQILCAGII